MVTLSAEVQRLRAERSGPATGLPQGVKVPVPASFEGKCDGDSVKNFIDSLENWFQLVNMSDMNQRARFASTLLQDKARTWFST